MALALLQGPFIALLGMAGGFMTPALIESQTPSAFALFGYLLALVAGSLAVVRYKAWWWFAWAALAGSGSWLVMWFGIAWRPGDALPLGGFLLALAGLFLFVLPREADPPVTGWNPFALAGLGPGLIARVAATVAALFILMLVRVHGYGGTSVWRACPARSYLPGGRAALRRVRSAGRGRGADRRHGDARVVFAGRRLAAAAFLKKIMKLPGQVSRLAAVYILEEDLK